MQIGWIVITIDKNWHKRMMALENYKQHCEKYTTWWYRHGRTNS